MLGRRALGPVIQIGSLASPRYRRRSRRRREPSDWSAWAPSPRGVREEKYFVVLEQDDERPRWRVSGCWRRTARRGIQQEREARIQVLRAPMLRTFAASSKQAEVAQGALEEQKAADERDRNGPLRALVACGIFPRGSRYAAICGPGWQSGGGGVGGATVSLDSAGGLLFLEAHATASPRRRGTLLRRVRNGVPDHPCRVADLRLPGVRAGLMFRSRSELDAILKEQRGNLNPDDLTFGQGSGQAMERVTPQQPEAGSRRPAAADRARRRRRRARRRVAPDHARRRGYRVLTRTTRGGP